MTLSNPQLVTHLIVAWSTVRDYTICNVVLTEMGRRALSIVSMPLVEIL